VVSGFVYVIESPSGRDLLDGRTEGRVLTETLQLAGVPYSYSLVVDREMLAVALGERLEAALKHHRCPPILHLSMHGNQDGVALTDGEFVAWHDLRHLLLPLLRALGGGLLVCMSSCFGSSGCRMAMYEDDEPPFWALVGNLGKPTWSDAAVAYSCFYHLFFKGVDVQQCVHSMGLASGDAGFRLWTGAEVRASWADFLRQRVELERLFSGTSPLVPSTGSA
jgi:hypothetical protein